MGQQNINPCNMCFLETKAIDEDVNVKQQIKNLTRSLVIKKSWTKLSSDLTYHAIANSARKEINISKVKSNGEIDQSPEALF